MKKHFSQLLAVFLVVVLAVVVLVACVPPQPGPGPEPNPNPTPTEPKLKQSKVNIVLPDSSVARYTDVTVTVEQTDLPLYAVKVNNVHSWTPNPTTSRSQSGVGYFSLLGKAQISVKAENMQSCVVRPLSAGVQAVVENGVATFTLSSAGNYSVEPDGDAKRAFFLFVSPWGEPQYPSEGTIIRFAKGVHTSANNSYIRGNVVTLGSNTTVILDEGAVVRARFVANNAQNITICGRGIIDGAAFVRNASTGEVTVPLDFNFCKNIVFKDFSVLDPAGWCVNWYFCTDSTIDGIKIISSRSNGDGISLQSCKRINVANCFLRTWDDSLVVKNYPQWSNRNVEGSTENITFENCTLWTDLAQSMEIGYETVGQKLSDVTFKNITVLHNFHKPVMSIHNGNNADVRNVLYDTITVEDASMGRGDAGSNNQLCEFSVAYNATWSSQHKVTALGSISGVTVQNVTVLAGNIILPVRIAGCRDSRSGYGNSVHTVTDVTLQNIWLLGKKMQAKNVTANDYTGGINVIDGTSAVVAPFAFSMTVEQLAEYTDTAEVSAN